MQVNPWLLTSSSFVCRLVSHSPLFQQSHSNVLFPLDKSRRHKSYPVKKMSMSMCTSTTRQLLAILIISQNSPFLKNFITEDPESKIFLLWECQYRLCVEALQKQEIYGLWYCTTQQKSYYANVTMQTTPHQRVASVPAR